VEDSDYFELSLHKHHKLQVWPSAKFCILLHPKKCNINDDSCREKIIKYIHHEGIFDKLLDQSIIMIDSYVEETFN